MASRGPLTFDDLDSEEDVAGIEESPPTDGTLNSSPLFGTPLSEAASQTAGGVGLLVGSKVGLLLYRRSDNLCMGLIKGSGATRWCTKKYGNCVTC